MTWTSSRLVIAGCSLGALLSLSPVGASSVFAQEPAGPPFQVNTYTAYYRARPSVGIDGTGRFVVVWSGNGPGDTYGVFARRFGPDGSPSGPDVRVNSYTTNAQMDARVAVQDDGSFLVVWRGFAPGSGGIFARRFDADGTPAGDQFQVNAPAPYVTRERPAVAGDPAGGFIVAWQDGYPLSEIPRALTRRFDAAGLARGPQFEVASGGSEYDYIKQPRMASAPNGQFVVVWHGFTYVDEDNVEFERIAAQRVGADDAPAGAAVHASGLQFDRDASVAMDPAGGFVVTWSRSTHVWHRRYDPANVPRGPALRVNVDTANPFDTPPDVAADRKGGFVVVWEHETPRRIVGRRHDRTGHPMTGEFAVSSDASFLLAPFPSVAVGPSGEFVVVWHQSGNVLARRFILPEVIFGDGFESGDLAAWQTVSSNPDLTVAAEAALAGTNQGLRIHVDDRQGVFVQDETPNAEDRYRVRFHVDPNGFDPGEAQGHRRVMLFLGLSEEPIKRLVMVVLRRLGGSYAVRGRVRLDDNTLVETPFVPISDDPHQIDLDWRRASAPGANDGSFELSVDGVAAPALTGLDNDARGIDSGRLGAISVKTGAAGVLFLDEFVSRRR